MDISKNGKNKEKIIFTILVILVIGFSISAILLLSKDALLKTVIEKDSSAATANNAIIKKVDVTIVPVDS